MSKSQSALHPILPGLHGLAVTALLLATLLLNPARAAGELNRWSAHGIPGGDVFSLAIDPQDPSTLYAGTALPVEQRTGRCPGIFRSTDGGDTWTSFNRNIGFTACVNDILVDPRNPAGIFVATNNQLFRKSQQSDFWIPAGPFCRFLTLAIDPQDSTILYAGTGRRLNPSCGVLRSTDGGRHWAPINEGFPGGPDDLPTFSDLAVDPLNPARIYAATTGAGVFRSLDGGETWTRLPNAPDDVLNLAIDPADPDNLYADAFRSSDGGESWEEGPLAGAAVQALAIDPTDPDVLFAGTGSGVFRSTDRGTTWSEELGDLYVDVRFLTVDPATSTVYAGTFRSGVFRSTDGGGSWTASSDGPLSQAVFLLAVEPPSSEGGTDPDDPAPVFAATFDGLYRSLDGGVRWWPRQRGLSFQRPIFTWQIRDLVFDPLDPSTLYLAQLSPTGEVFRSTDGGDSWHPAGDLGQRGPRALAIDPDTPSNLLAGTGSGVFRSTDSGDNWERVFGEDRTISNLEIAPSEPSRVYAIVFAAAGDRLLLSDDGGISWAEIEGPPAHTAALAVDPEDPHALFAATESGVFRSPDGGMTWISGLAGLGEAPIRSLEIVSESDGRTVLYAATRWFSPGRVVRSIDRGMSWWPVADLPRTSIETLAVDPRTSRLYAGGNDEVEFLTGPGVFQIEQVPTLELHDGRFRVEVEWREFHGIQGRGYAVSVSPGAPGEPVPLRSRDSAVLEFFGPDNWEMLIKVLDGRTINDHFWVFFAAATNVGYTLTVIDTACGQQQNYLNIRGRPAPAVTDIEAFGGCPSPDPPSCEADEDTLCLGEGGRFQVDLAWHDFVGNTGVGRPVTIPEGGLASSDDSGLFYFFGNDNWEVLVKVLDGCRFNHRFWVFSAATTDVEYWLTVTDTATGEVRTYFNPLDVDAGAVTDVDAFDTCDATPVPP